MLELCSRLDNAGGAMSNLFVKLIVVVACLLSGNAFAQEPGKLAPLPNKLPPSVEQRVGTVDFSRGLPTPNGIQKLFEIQDFQRATQLYQWAIPAIGVLGWHRASIANGKTGETDWVIYDNYAPRQGILTPSTEVSYVMAFPDLEKIGPLVLDYGPGKIAGIVMDYWQRPQFDFGLTGPEKGEPGKALIVGRGKTCPTTSPVIMSSRCQRVSRSLATASSTEVRKISSRLSTSSIRIASAIIRRRPRSSRRPRTTRSRHRAASLIGRRSTN
jgi:Protein of unknown function (DUF1254)